MIFKLHFWYKMDKKNAHFVQHQFLLFGIQADVAQGSGN